MTIDFHHNKNRSSYAQRQANPTWLKMIEKLVHVKGKNVVDVGCGGGIYSKALAQLGASHVSGVDFSEQMLEAARENCSKDKNITFTLGDALHTNLPDEYYDMILERALSWLRICFLERGAPFCTS